MKKLYFLAISVFVIASCTSIPDYDEDAVRHATKQEIKANAESVFGTSLDPNHDWSNVTKKTVSITANADLDDIVKVQILTESPLFNEEASILGEADVKKGQTVTLSFEMPDDLTELMAACIDSNGKYNLQVFDVNDQSISFASASKARTRSAFSDNLPNASDIKLAGCIKSFNALRAEEASTTGYVSVHEKTDATGTLWTYDEWNDGSWIEDRLWSAEDKSLGSTWKIQDGVIFKNSDPIDEKEAANLKKIILDDFLVKKASSGDIATNGKRNNLTRIRKSKYFELENNYLTTNGKDPLVITPVQAWSTEYTYNDVYYYYFLESEIAGKSDDDVKKYIKHLPKYKAIDLIKYEYGNKDQFKKKYNYLLPFYGPNPTWDGTSSILKAGDYPTIGKTAVSTIIPKGYKVGFLNRKDFNNQGMSNSCGSGCVYGDGRLNREVNHLIGHYLGAVDKTLSFKTHGQKAKYGNTIEGMQWEDPRSVMFSVNDKTYMCFEDGADCNYCDLIIEVSSGIDVLDETIEVFYTVYTMCFEDHELGDYDMNDIVIKAMRLPGNKVLYSIEACGAHDELYIYNIGGTTINENAEVHALFGVKTDTFVNTQENGVRKHPVQEIVDVDENFSFSNPDDLPYIENRTKNNTVKIAKNGEDPHGIVIPFDYKYPTEKTTISEANKQFLEWARDKNSISSKGWYRTGEENLIYTQSIFEHNASNN